MENTNPNSKNEIITLILADMRSRKLIMGLDAVGLSTDDFNSNLSELIFLKMGFAKEDEVIVGNWYEDLVFNVLDIELDIFRHHQLFLAITIYDALQEKSRKMQTQLLLKSKPNIHSLPWASLRRFDN